MGWGGARKGAGRRKPVDNRPQPMFSDASVQAIIEMVRESRDRAEQRRRGPEWNPYIIRPEKFGPAAEHIKQHKRSLAMDSNTALMAANAVQVGNWAGGGGGDAGMLFLGYSFLSDLVQRAEYRLFGEIMSEEMTRKFIDIRGTDDESMKETEKEDKEDGETDAQDEVPQFKSTPEPKEEKKPRSDGRNKEIERKIVELRQFAEEIKLREVFKTLAGHDQTFGIGHLYLDLEGANVDDIRDPENAMSIGNGRDKISEGKLSAGCLRGLRTIEPVWCYPIAYNANNPLSPDWYNPQVWYVMGAEIHKTRLIPFIGRPIPDILKPAYAFGGLPMTQMAQPYVDIWLRTRQSVADLIHNFSTPVLQTNMGTIVQPGGAGGGGGDVVARMMLFNMLRDNQDMLIVDKATEDFKNIAVPLSTLDALQAQAQEHMCAVARIPTVKFTGIQPAGLNATSEGELRAFNDTVHGQQEHLFRSGLTTVLDIMMISLWGKRDEDITFDFEPLHEMTELEKSDAKKKEAETDQIRIDSGVVSPEEVRSKLVADPDSGFHGLDPDDVPEMLEEEAGGLIPPGSGKGLEAVLGGGAKPKPKPDSSEDQAMDGGEPMSTFSAAWRAAIDKDRLGYLRGLSRFYIEKDLDQWHSEYDPDTDEIVVQQKLLADPLHEQTRTLLHEAGHRGQYLKDKSVFRKFKQLGLDTIEHFEAMANATHMHDFRRIHHVDDKSGEVFAESYARFCLGMEMPAALKAFWTKLTTI
jgi:hypothetical protein